MRPAITPRLKADGLPRANTIVVSKEGKKQSERASRTIANSRRARGARRIGSDSKTLFESLERSKTCGKSDRQRRLAKQEGNQMPYIPKQLQDTRQAAAPSDLYLSFDRCLAVSWRMILTRFRG